MSKYFLVPGDERDPAQLRLRHQLLFQGQREKMRGQSEVHAVLGLSDIVATSLACFPLNITFQFGTLFWSF